MSAKSKPFYLKLRSQREMVPRSLTYWKREFPNFSFNIFYKNKIKPMKVSKIKEFLFKISHNICLCQENLYKWKISEKKDCPYCGNPNQNIKHLLWECPQTFQLWNTLSENLHININYEYIILGGNNRKLNNVISVIMYIIYKKFVEDLNSNNTISLFDYTKKELQAKIALFNFNKFTTEAFIPLKSTFNLLF